LVLFCYFSFRRLRLKPDDALAFNSLEVNTRMGDRTVVISCRVTRRFADLIKRFCELDAHVNQADLLRDSVREKIQREAPELYRQLFEEVET